MLLLSIVFMLREMSDSVGPRRWSADMVGVGTCLGWCTDRGTPWLAVGGAGGAVGGVSISCSNAAGDHIAGVRSTMGADFVERGI